MHTEDQSSTLRIHAVEAVRRLQAAGFEAYWAGGSVRDMLMGRTPKDYDIATAAHPDQVIALFPHATLVGKCFGVVRAPMGQDGFDIATFRKDHAYDDGRRPSGVTFSDAQTDARRRDFTINAVFYDPIADRYLDVVGGRRDMDNRLLRCVGDPAARFAEDYLRLLRAVRFTVVLELVMHPDTAAAIRAAAPSAAAISPERVRDELDRMLREAPRAGDAIRRLDELSLLDIVLPEVAAMKGQAQPPEFHPEGDVFTHTLIMLDRMHQPSRTLAWAVLLHDVGKPPTASCDGTRIRFNGHASEGARMAERILRRLRFSTRDTTAIVHLIHSHMRFQDVRQMRRSTLRRMVGGPYFDEELELHRLDCLASHGHLDHYQFATDFREALAREPALPEPWITGRDILSLGVPEGPAVGTWHTACYEAQLDGRFPDRQALLEWLRKEIEAGR